MHTNMEILDKIITTQLESFSLNFSNVSKSIFYDENINEVIHPGEYGMLRESIVRDLLQHFLPESFGVSQGFIVSPDGTVSNQCDIIIYSKIFGPRITTAEQQRFFPIESVVVVGEVKSTIDITKIKESLVKLSNIKKMRADLKNGAVAWSIFRDIGKYNPYNHHLDQIGTFLIADHFSCQDKSISNLLDDVSVFSELSFKPNLLVSVKDYLVCYKDKKNIIWMYPHDVDENKHIINAKLPVVFSYPIDNSVEHLKLFIRYLEFLVTRTTILYPEFTSYFGNFTKIKTVNEKDLQ